MVMREQLRIGKTQSAVERCYFREWRECALQGGVRALMTRQPFRNRLVSFVVPALGRLCLHKLYVFCLEQLQHLVHLQSTGVGGRVRCGGDHYRVTAPPSNSFSVLGRFRDATNHQPRDCYPYLPAEGIEFKLNIHSRVQIAPVRSQKGAWFQMGGV